MSMKPFFAAGLLALALPLSAADLSPSAKTLPTAVPTLAPAAPVAASPSAKAGTTVAPTVVATAAAPAPASPTVKTEAPPLPAELSNTPEVLAAPASGTAGADEPIVAEEVGEDGGSQAKTESPDLSKADSETLAAIAGGVDKDATDVFFDPAAKQCIPDAAPGSWKVNVDALYYELAKRTLNDNKDKAARQAFALTLFKDAERAKYAKDLAYDDKLADTVIAQLEGGRARARMDLQTLAEKGNRKARAYLGLDKPMEHAEAGALSPSAQASTATAAASPDTTTPSAAPVALTGTAAKAEAPKALSTTTAPASASTPTAAPKK